MNRRAYNINFSKFLTGSSKNSSGKLFIPAFQRNYVWGSKQHKKIIDSINNNEEHFYVGNIVIKVGKDGVGGRDEIIDGQQRLVTLTLIASAIKELKGKNYQTLNNLIFYSHRSPRIVFNRKKLDRVFKSILLNSPLKNPDTIQEGFLKNYKSIKSYVKNNTDLDSFISKLEKLDLIVIKCEASASAYQLFEGLNARGKKLTSTELIKNDLFAKHVESVGNNDNSINLVWERMESKFEKAGVSNVWFPKFVRHNWFSIGGYVTDSGLFEKISNYISRSTNPLEFSEELEKYSDVYIKLRKPELLNKDDLSSQMSDVAWQKTQNLLSVFSTLGLDQIYSVLLAMFKYGETKQSYYSRSFAEDLHKILAAAITYKYSQVNPSSYEKAYATFCYDLCSPDSTMSYKESKDKLFASLKKHIPSKKIFSEKLAKSILCDGRNSEKLSSDSNRTFHRFLLIIYLSDGRRVIPEHSVEHIIPKGDLAKWTNIGTKYRKIIEEDKRYRIGNLTLLDKDLLENDSFSNKYDKAYSLSDFPKNVRLNTYGFDKINPARAVNMRSKEIAESVYEIFVKMYE